MLLEDGSGVLTDPGTEGCSASIDFPSLIHPLCTEKHMDVKIEG